MTKKHMTKRHMMAVFILIMGILSLSVNMLRAEEPQSDQSGDDETYPDMGDSEEEQAYREFLQNGEEFSDIKNLSEIMYAVYDIDQDGKNELILRGKMTNLGEYQYLFYCYQDGTVKTIGSMKNAQSAGTGEMYYAPKGKGVVVDMTIAGAKFYYLYQVKNKIKLYFTISRHDGFDYKEVNGELQPDYIYDLEYENGQSAGKNITGKEWDEFENDLIEIPFYDVQDEEETEQVAQNENLPFYGIWCYGSKGEGEANSYADTLRSNGFDAQVFMTTDWSNLNTEPFYVVTAGVYGAESEAKAALASVQDVCPQAYVKYSGDYRS